jgi:diguanylate cyclase (GGDEF)-like protein
MFICDDSINANDMRNQLEQFAVRTEIADSVSDLLHKIDIAKPDVILIESSESEGLAASIHKIQQIKQALPHSPSLVVVSTDSSIGSRLSAIKAGAAAYFLGPVKVAELVNFLHLQQQKETEPAYRVMIVDDDRLVACHTALLLEQADIETHVVTEPMDALESLITFQPDLILMDLHMPECSGLELAAVIRQHCNYAGVAIVFFSVDSDIDRHIDVLRSGGDEFLVKSTNPARLLATVEARAKRSREIQRLMLRDSLTGLLNRSSMDEYLRMEASKIKRQNGCFSYVILDLDHFKQVNDSYGHPVGDEVLKSLGLMLVKRLRAVDMVGRYGGEEFAIILPDTSALQAEHVLSELLRTFKAIKFNASGKVFSVTFSAGIAEYPVFANLAYLIEAADQALYQAKAEGRSRVCLACASSKVSHEK